MYNRSLPLPGRSFFLFGPRGTGKTTWLRAVLPDAAWVDLVRSEELLRHLRDPGLLRRQTEALPAGSWVVIDEVQKLPRLLDDVQGLIAEHGQRYRFAISGSSARKLKRLEANLLAGRAIYRRFFPLTASERGEGFTIDQALRFGGLPAVAAAPHGAVDILEAYVTTYLQQEIQQEAFVHDFGSFARFLEVAALLSGQAVNMSNVARDAGVARPTAQRYFDVLTSTLIGVWLPAWRSKAKVRETSHPKFYFFDPGVVRAIAGTLRDPLGKEERGALLEAYVLHELRAYQNASNCGGTLSYWRLPSGVEVDFVWTRAKQAVGVEVKASATWKPEHASALKRAHAEGILTRCFAVYTGPQRLKDGPIDVLPAAQFCRELAAGRLIA
jgi:predicted AAA+ superfamily ATPase